MPWRGCGECRRREECTELCGDALENIGEPLPAEFVRQFQENPDEWPTTGKSRNQIIRELFFYDHRSTAYIAEHFSLTDRMVRYILRPVKDIIEDE